MGVGGGYNLIGRGYFKTVYGRVLVQKHPVGQIITSLLFHKTPSGWDHNKVITPKHPVGEIITRLLFQNTQWVGS